jgi:hypothetical protein
MTTESLDIFEFNKKYSFITGYQGRKIDIRRQFERQLKRYTKDYIIVGIERAWVWLPHDELRIGLLGGCLHVHISNVGFYAEKGPNAVTQAEGKRDFYEIQYIKARKRGNKYYKMLFCPDPECGEQVDYKKFKALEVMYKLK